MHNFLKLKLCFKKKKNWFWGDMLKLWSDWSYQDPSLHLDRHRLTIRNQFSAFPAASELHADSSTQPKQEQRWEETKQKYSITVEFSGICTWVFSSDNFLLLHTTFFFFLISVLSTSYKLKTGLLLLVCRNWRELFHHCRPPTSSRLEPKQ